MHDNRSFQWVHYSTENVPIKVESQQPELSLLSPPSSPSLHNVSPSLSRRRSASPKRPRPYPTLVTRFDNRLRAQQEESKMPSSSYNPWSTRSSRSGSDRASSSEGQPPFSTGGGYPNPSSSYTGDHNDRPTSSSSLSGAMGDPNMPHSRYSDSPSGGLSDPMSWTRSLQSTSLSTMGMHAMGYAGLEPNLLDPPFQEYRGGSSGSSPPSSFTSPSYADPFRTSAGMYDNMASAHPVSPPSSSTYIASPQDEIRNLRRRIKELERINERERDRVRALEAGTGPGSSRSPVGGRGTVSALPMSASFQESWRLRTEARQRQFCSLNRAGNALCAWHDSRRERRVHPPRMAPPGYLNCGCTFEEALFEESLSRHGVGSYLPGENVRMDPALRNPLLKLLQERYAYRDGDFERDPRNGDWLPNEGHALWEQQAQSSNPRRTRTDPERR